MKLGKQARIDVDAVAQHWVAGPDSCNVSAISCRAKWPRATGTFLAPSPTLKEWGRTSQLPSPIWLRTERDFSAEISTRMFAKAMQEI